MCEGGRDREGIELVEYCDRRFLDACDIGRGRVLLRAGGDVINGGRAGWAVAAAGGDMAGGEVAGEEPGDMMAVIVGISVRGRGVSLDWRWLRWSWAVNSWLAVTAFRAQGPGGGGRGCWTGTRDAGLVFAPSSVRCWAACSTGAGMMFGRVVRGGRLCSVLLKSGGLWVLVSGCASVVLLVCARRPWALANLFTMGARRPQATASKTAAEGVRSGGGSETGERETNWRAAGQLAAKGVDLRFPS